MLIFLSTSDSDLDRKSLKRPDSFVTSMRRFFASILSHTTAVLVVLGVLFLVGVSAALYWNHRENRANQAQGALFVARQAIQREHTKLAAAEPAPAPAKAEKGKKAEEQKPVVPNPDTVLNKPLNVDAQMPESVTQLKKVIDQFGGTRAAFEARLALGDLYYDHGEPAKAVPLYEQAARSAPDKEEKTGALYALGYAHENSAKCPEALKAYDEALRVGDSALKGDLLLAIARCYEMTKETAKARSTYDRILSELPNTDYAKMAETLKAQAE